MTVSNFTILESQEGGCLRLCLTGEFDIASVPVLDDRLSRSRSSGVAVRLDLSRLDFIDSSGLHALIRAMNEASADGWRLEIDRDVAAQALRVFELTGVARLIPGFDSNKR